jgi:hypothetical protein
MSWRHIAVVPAVLALGCAISSMTVADGTALADPGPPNLVLAPPQGSPGTWSHATATGFDSCLADTSSRSLVADAVPPQTVGSGTVSFEWDGGTLTSATLDAGSATVVLTVPEDTELGVHTVTASCVSGAQATATFTVIPAEEPALVLAPEQGAQGASFTATATGFAPCLEGWYGGGPQTMSFYWDDRDLAPAETDTSDPHNVNVEFTVPDRAATGAHTVAVWCSDHTASATFTVNPPDKLSLTLAPAQGSPGTSFTATTTGFGNCDTLSFRWGDQALTGSTDNIDSQEFSLTVPDEAGSGAQTVTASCEGGGEATAAFTVVTAAEPALTLSTRNGTPGSPVTASGSGFACDGDRVQLFWDGDSPLQEAPSGEFTVALTVPTGVPAGDHSVVATCRNHTGISDRQPFTVTSVAIPGNVSPVLTLQPTSGPRGSAAGAAGDHFACAAVQLSWDDGTRLPNASPDPSGHFNALVPVPTHVGGGLLTLRAACPGGVLAAADFTVLSGPSVDLRSDSKFPWWLIALIVAIAIVAILALRHWRRSGPPEAPMPTVRAVPRPGGTPLVTVRETPARGEATHAIRLAVHPDAGIQTIREVEDDDSRPG